MLATPNDLVGLAELRLVDALLRSPLGDRVVVVELDALDVDRVERGIVEFAQFADRFRRVVQLADIGPLRAAEGHRHTPEADIGRQLRSPPTDQRMEVVAVGTAVGEELDDLDLRRVVGGLRRLDVDVIAAQRQLCLRRSTDQQAGSEGDKGGQKIALFACGDLLSLS